MELNEPGMKDKLENIRKFFVFIATALVGVLLLVYILQQSYWEENFGTYTMMVMGLSALLVVVGLLLMIIDIKRFLRHELIGFIVGIVAAVVLLLHPSAPALNIEVGSAIMYVGMIIAVVAAVILARNGGYLSLCVIGLGFQIIALGYYPMMNPEMSNLHPNSFLAAKIGAIFLIISLILMVYQEAKFFFLVPIIKNANRLRQEKKYDEAMKLIDKALMIYPYFVTALNNKGNLLFNLKKPKESLEYYNKAISINPNYKQAQNNLEVVQRKLGRATS